MKIIGWVVGIMLIAILLFGYFNVAYEKRILNNCSKQTNGTITDFYKIRNRGYFIEFKYTVSDSTYAIHTQIASREKRDFDKIGTQILVNYSCVKPNIASYQKFMK